MSNITNFAEKAPNLPFTEDDFYELYRETFEQSELGRIKRLLPLHELATSCGLMGESLRPKRGRRSYFTPEGKVALMFLKMYTQLSFPKLLEQLNGNIHFEIFCDVLIDPLRPLTNYKLLDDIAAELAGKMKIQELQEQLAKAWKPWMKDLVHEAGPPVSREEGAGLRTCRTGPGARHHDGGLVRDAEGALRSQAGKGQEEGDGDPVHLLRHPHGERGESGRKAVGDRIGWS